MIFISSPLETSFAPWNGIMIWPWIILCFNLIWDPFWLIGSQPFFNNNLYNSEHLIIYLVCILIWITHKGLFFFKSSEFVVSGSWLVVRDSWFQFRCRYRFRFRFQLCWFNFSNFNSQLSAFIFHLSAFIFQLSSFIFQLSSFNHRSLINMKPLRGFGSFGHFFATSILPLRGKSLIRGSWFVVVVVFVSSFVD